MKSKKLITLVVLYISFILPFRSFAEDTLQAYILTDINKKNPEDIKIQKCLTGKCLYFVYGYLKMVSNVSNVEAVEYLFEWAYDNGEKEIILTNYKSSSDYLIYKRKVDRINDYYWTKKSIYGDKTGKYIFRVFEKGITNGRGDNKIIVKAEASIIVEEQEI